MKKNSVVIILLVFVPLVSVALFLRLILFPLAFRAIDDSDTRKVDPAQGMNVTELMSDAQLGNVGAVKEDIRNGAPINLRNNHGGNTALFLAAGLGRSHVVRILLASGADPNILNDQGQSPLIIAAATGRVDVVRTLLEAGANTRTSDHYGQTALLYAQHFARLFSDDRALPFQRIAVLLKEYALKQDQARKASPAPKPTH